MSQRPSAERIVLMDKILNVYLESKYDRVDGKSFMKENDISRSVFDSAESMTLEYLDEMGFIVSELLGYGGRAFVRWKDKSEAIRFKESGGFSNYYQSKTDNQSAIHISNTTIRGNNYGTTIQGRDFLDIAIKNKVNAHPSINESATKPKSWYEIPFVKYVLLPLIITAAGVCLTILFSKN